MTSLIGTSKRALNLSLNYQIVISKPVPSSKNLAYDFSDSAAGKMVSPKTLRQEYNIKRDEFRRRQFVLDSQIRLVDGSKMDLSQVKPQKLKSQPKQDAKLEAQIVIKQQRYQEKIFSEIIRILISGVLSVEIFRNPVWRLTRLVPNKDMRGYTVYWIIDNEDDVSIFQVTMPTPLYNSVFIYVGKTC